MNNTCFGFGGSGSGGGGGGSTATVLNFRIGDGGPFTPNAGQPVFNPSPTNPLVGATVLGMFGGNLFISPTDDAAIGDLSWGFISGTGILTLSNGNFDDNVVYSIWYNPA